MIKLNNWFEEMLRGAWMSGERRIIVNKVEFRVNGN